MEKGFFDEEQFECEVFPTFIRIFETEVDEQSDIPISRMLGRFIHYLPDDRLRVDPIYSKIYLALLKRFFNASSENFPLVKANLAYNFPCLYKYFSKYESGESFRTAFMNFTVGI